MANSAYWKNCVREIRQSVYGRDNRKPIADSVKKTRAWHEHEIEVIAEKAIKKVGEMDPTLTEMEQKPSRAIGSFLTEPMETWYTYDYRDVELQDVTDPEDKTMEAVTDSLTVGLIEGDDYLLVDSVEGDGSSVLSGENYIWNIPNPIKETHVHHGEDYILIITRINGH